MLAVGEPVPLQARQCVPTRTWLDDRRTYLYYAAVLPYPSLPGVAGQDDA